MLYWCWLILHFVQVTSILKEAKGRIQASIGDLASPLKERLGDSNKNLVSTTLVIIGLLPLGIIWCHP